MKNLKKIISFFSVSMFAIIMIVASSYVGRPLFGTSPNQDNTGRQLTYGSLTINDTAGTVPDTITIVPSHYDKFYTLNLVDSCVIAIKTTSSAFTYSHIHFIINAGSAPNSNVKFLGYSGLASQWSTSTSGTTKFSVTSSHSATISFICTGTKFAEEFRSQD